MILECSAIFVKFEFNKGAMAQWYSQLTSVFEVAGLIPAPVIVIANDGLPELV